MSTDSRPVDPQKIKAGGERIFGYLKGMGVSAMIYLGDKLGLYQALDGAGPVTSEDLAQKTGLHERWVREWIRGQAAAADRKSTRLNSSHTVISDAVFFLEKK